MKLVIVQIRRGRHKGKFGWVLTSDVIVIQCPKVFDSVDEAEADGEEFRRGGEALH